MQDTERPDIVSRLRAATGEAHARLDARLNIVDELSRPEGRRRLVARFFGLHAGAEPALAPLLSPIDGLDFEGRDRSPLLERDIAVLGLDRERVPVCPVEPPRTEAEALGFFYVLEGSTLGGRIIRREMETRGVAGDGLSFLDPYGSDTGARWRAFLDVLRARVPAGDDARAAAVVRGGVAGFVRAETWLCEAA
jgi:heme oxygenase